MPDINRRAYLKRRRAELFMEQHGDCYWCHDPMVLLENYPVGTLEPDVCTLDHMFDRGHPQRRKQKHGIQRYVAACWRCNHGRGVETTKRIKAAAAHSGVQVT